MVNLNTGTVIAKQSAVHFRKVSCHKNGHIFWEYLSLLHALIQQTGISFCRRLLTRVWSVLSVHTRINRERARSSKLFIPRPTPTTESKQTTSTGALWIATLLIHPTSHNKAWSQHKSQKDSRQSNKWVWQRQPNNIYWFSYWLIYWRLTQLHLQPSQSHRVSSGLFTSWNIAQAK